MPAAAPATLRTVLTGRPYLVRLLAIVILGALTLGFHAAPQRYAVVESDLVSNLDWSRHGVGWIGSRHGLRLDEGERPTVTLWRDRQQRRMPYLLRELPIPPTADHLLVAASVRVKGVADSRNVWELASLHLEHFDSEHRRMGYWPYRLAAIAGDTDWQRISRVFPLFNDAARLRFVAFLGSPAGTLEIADLSIREARETQASIAIGWALRAGWALLLLACVLPIVRRLGLNRWRGMVLAMAATIGAGSMTPQPELGIWATDARAVATALGLQARQMLASGVEDLSSPELAESDTGDAAPDGAETEADPPAPSRAERSPAAAETEAEAEAEGKVKSSSGATPRTPKSAREAGPSSGAALAPFYHRPWYKHPALASLSVHFAGYLALALAAVLAYRQWPVLAVLLPVAAVAFATECLQSFMVTRDTELSDFLANAGGIAVGGGLALLILRLRGPLWQRFAGVRAGAP